MEAVVGQRYRTAFDKNPVKRVNTDPISNGKETV